ncbi:MAG: NADH-ubiquinone oxidoreductase-F iron-sulfur binding region domain-containing protein [Thermoleophilaceae bacterium]
MSDFQRLLAGLPGADPIGLEQHLELHGQPPHTGPGDGPALVDAVEASGLCGRGGASFPTAAKLAAVASRRRPVVVVNGTEAEPMSTKDAVLLELVPHLVLDGAVLASHAVAARECVIACPRESHAGLRAAIGERERLGGSGVRIKLASSPPGYVGGEETALIAHLEGRPPKPRVTPPYPAERGLNGRPTLVQNVETLAHLALIARRGPDWFREVGSSDRPGTTLVTVSGAVASPGVCEIPSGASLPDVIARAGGGLEPIRALLVGGYFGAWVDGIGDGLRFDDASLRAAGAAAGAGVVIALGQSACPVAETSRLATWLAGESAGQCGPCVHGLGGLSDILQRVAGGGMKSGDQDRLIRWVHMVRGRGACRHPDGASRMIASATRVFTTELNDHARHGPCDACGRIPTLALGRRGDAVAA